MGIGKPFKRTARPQARGKYLETGHYIKHPKYASDPVHYVRAFQILQKDLLELFDYVEPADENLKSYSFRIHELHTRACIEIEANCKAILLENGYSKQGHFNMEDYAKLEPTHHLSSFQVRLPSWRGKENPRTPFKEWKHCKPLTWYQAYNSAKHSRHENFDQSNFQNMLEAMCGLVAILAAQFASIEFAKEGVFADSSPVPGYDVAIGGYFEIKYPDDWPKDQWYVWKWEDICNDPDPFQKLFAS